MSDKNKADYSFLCIIIIYIILIAGCLVYSLVLYNIIIIPECMVHELFGIYCPGCGGTRAVMALFRGNFIKSFLYNPIVPSFFVITSIYIVLNIIARILKNDKLRIPFYNEFGYLLVFILILNCIFKNYLLLQHGIKM